MSMKLFIYLVWFSGDATGLKNAVCCIFLLSRIMLCILLQPGRLSRTKMIITLTFIQQLPGTSCCRRLYSGWTILHRPSSNSLAAGDFCRLLKTFANSLDPDQARRNVGPDLGPSCLTL